MRHNGFSSASAGLLTSGLGAVGVWVGLVGMFGSPRPVHIGWLLPLSGVQLGLDPLGGFFIALTGAVAIPRRRVRNRIRAAGASRPGPLAVLPLFVAAMLLVPAAGT